MTSTRSTRSATGFSPSANTTAKSRGRSSGPSPAKTSTASSPASPTASPISGSRPKNQNFRPAVLALYSSSLDLLIVGARGYGPVGRLIHGSTSQQLAHTARCPLLVLARVAHASEMDEAPRQAG